MWWAYIRGAYIRGGAYSRRFTVYPKNILTGYSKCAFIMLFNTSFLQNCNIARAAKKKTCS